MKGSLRKVFLIMAWPILALGVSCGSEPIGPSEVDIDLIDGRINGVRIFELTKRQAEAMYDIGFSRSFDVARNDWQYYHPQMEGVLLKFPWNNLNGKEPYGGEPCFEVIVMVTDDLSDVGPFPGKLSRGLDRTWTIERFMETFSDQVIRNEYGAEKVSVLQELFSQVEHERQIGVLNDNAYEFAKGRLHLVDTISPWVELVTHNTTSFIWYNGDTGLIKMITLTESGSVREQHARQKLNKYVHRMLEPVRHVLTNPDLIDKMLRLYEMN